MTRSTQRFVLGAAVMAVGAFLVVALMFVPVPAGNRDFVYTLTGLLLGWGGAVVQFYFGTSEGSVAKSEQIDRIMKGDEQ
jgi:biotin transporter BioY